MNGGWGISYEIALRWMPLDLTDDTSTLVQVMAWCCMSPNGITRPQWVKGLSWPIPGSTVSHCHEHLPSLVFSVLHLLPSFWPGWPWPCSLLPWPGWWAGAVLPYASAAWRQGHSVGTAATEEERITAGKILLPLNYWCHFYVEGWCASTQDCDIKLNAETFK